MWGLSFTSAALQNDFIEWLWILYMLDKEGSFSNRIRPCQKSLSGRGQVIL